MAVTVEQVEKWLILKGIGHAVGLISHGWSYTACGMIFLLEAEDETPKRICRRCKEALKRCNLTNLPKNEGN